MTIRYYLVPVEEVGSARGPKYFNWRFCVDCSLNVPWSAMDYGLRPTMLIATDVTNGQHNGLAAASDVTTVPTNIDNTVSAAALSAVRAALEGLKIPGNWVTTAHTYREVLRAVAGLFQFAQRHQALHNEPLVEGNVDLSMTWSEVPQAKRQRVQATCDDLGYDTSPVTGAWTLGQTLKYLADLWGDTTFIFGNITTL